MAARTTLLVVAGAAGCTIAAVDVAARVTMFDGGAAALPIAVVAGAAPVIVLLSAIRYRRPADLKAWVLLSVTLASLACSEIVSVDQIDGQNSAARWWSFGFLVIAFVAGSIAAARFAAGLEMQGRVATRVRRMLVAIVALLSIGTQWTAAEWAIGSAESSSAIVFTGIIAAASVLLLVVVVRHRAISLSNELLIAGLCCLAIACAWGGGHASTRWLPVLLLSDAARWLWVIAGLHASSARTGLLPGAIRPRQSNGGTATMAVFLSGLVTWLFVGGPYANRVSLGVTAILAALLCIIGFAYEEHLSRQRPGSGIAPRMCMLRDDLVHSLADGSIAMWFQPIVRLSDGSHAGAEALVRWEHPELGTIGPEDLLAAAHLGGNDGLFTSFVLEQSFDLGRSILDTLDAPESYLSINVEPSQLQDGFADKVLAIAGRIGVESDGFVIEITETEQLLDNPHAADQIDRLQQMGFLVAIDDFGAGYANLGQLNELDVDIVKLDRALIAAATQDRGVEILRAAVAMAKSLGVIVMAEGVEDSRVGDMLHREGVLFAQGWAYGRPAPLASHPTLLLTQRDS